MLVAWNPDAMGLIPLIELGKEYGSRFGLNGSRVLGSHLVFWFVLATAFIGVIRVYPPLVSID